MRPCIEAPRITNVGFGLAGRFHLWAWDRHPATIPCPQMTPPARLLLRAASRNIGTDCASAETKKRALPAHASLLRRSRFVVAADAPGNENGYIDGLWLGYAGFTAQRATGAQVLIDDRFDTIGPSQGAGDRTRSRAGAAFRPRVGETRVLDDPRDGKFWRRRSFSVVRIGFFQGLGFARRHARPIRARVAPLFQQIHGRRAHHVGAAARRKREQDIMRTRLDAFVAPSAVVQETRLRCREGRANPVPGPLCP